jgi:hypothetical protein
VSPLILRDREVILRRLALWAPVVLGGLSVLLVLAHIQQIIGALYANGDVASAPVIGALIGHAPLSGRFCSASTRGTSRLGLYFNIDHITGPPTTYPTSNTVAEIEQYLLAHLRHVRHPGGLRQRQRLYLRPRCRQRAVAKCLGGWTLRDGAKSSSWR